MTTTTEELEIIEEKYKNAAGDDFVRKWQKGRVLGKGGFATCYEFKNMDNGVKWACKLVEKKSLTQNKAKAKLMSEIKIHRCLKHKNIVQFHNFFDDENRIYIMLEICENDSLHEMLTKRKTIEELEVQYFARALVTMLVFLRSKRIIHRDLKLGNILLSN